MKIKQYIPDNSQDNCKERRPPEKKYPMRRMVRSNTTGGYEIVFCREDGFIVSKVVGSDGIKYRDVDKTLLAKGYSIDFAEWDGNGKFIHENGTVEIKDWYPGVADELHKEQKKYPLVKTP